MNVKRTKQCIFRHLLILAGLLVTMAASTQQFTVKGTVKDIASEPIIGANVMVKGTTNGCITDIDGELKVIKGDNLLMLAEGKRKDHFTAGFDMDYAWNFLEGIRQVFLKDSCATTLIDIDRAEYDSIPAGKRKLRFTTNHDESVKMSPIREFGGERGSMAAFVTSTYLHGGALIYSSQEVGHPKRIDFFHYHPIDWSANPGLRCEYKILMKLYNEYPAIRKGSLKTYPGCDIFAFEKEADGQRILVVVNVRDSNQVATLPQAWKNHTCTNLFTNESEVLTESLPLASYEYKILKY